MQSDILERTAPPVYMSLGRPEGLEMSFLQLDRKDSDGKEFQHFGLKI